MMFFKKNDTLSLKLPSIMMLFGSIKVKLFTENNGKCSGLIQMVSIWGAKINKNIMQINIMK